MISKKIDNVAHMLSMYKHAIYTKLLHLRCQIEFARMSDSSFAQWKVVHATNWRNPSLLHMHGWTSLSVQHNIITWDTREFFSDCWVSLGISRKQNNYKHPMKKSMFIYSLFWQGKTHSKDASCNLWSTLITLLHYFPLNLQHILLLWTC